MTSNTPQYLRQSNESFELHEHLKRGGRPYSEGHRRCYLCPIEILRGAGLKPVDILEIGTGIGYGLNQMLQANIVRHYYGVEPNYESFQFTTANVAGRTNVHLINSTLDTVAFDFETLPICDYSFCIEVIEHVNSNDVPAFLEAIRVRTRRNLFLSTPCANRSTHGVATSHEWKRVLRANGFEVVAIERQWTTLYVCEPVTP